MLHFVAGLFVGFAFAHIFGVRRRDELGVRRKLERAIRKAQGFDPDPNYPKKEKEDGKEGF